MQNIASLLQGPPELSIIPHVSFGLQQLHHEEKKKQQQQQPNSSFWSGAALGLPDQAMQPFAALGVPGGTPHQTADDELEDLQLQQPYRFRHIVIRNRGAHDVHLVDVRLSHLLPALSHTFAVLDDHQLSKNKRKLKQVSAVRTGQTAEETAASQHQQQNYLGNGQRQSAVQQSEESEKTNPGVKAVLLSPGHEYQVTVALHCGDGSYRK